MINLHQALKHTDHYKKVELRDMMCVEYKCPARTPYANFWMDIGCLVYCTSGKKVYSSHAEDYEVRPGSVFYMKKGVYTGKNYFDEPYCAMMFFMPDSYFQDFLFRYSNLKFKDTGPASSIPDGIIPLTMDPSLEAFFNSILQYFFNVPNLNRQLLEVKLDEFTLNIFTQPAHKHFAAYLSTLNQDRIHNFKAVIEENFAGNLKLEELAHLCDMSLSTFKRYFFKVYGDAPGKWLIRRRLQLAQRLLRYSDKIVNEISFQCGFESPSHFIKVFKNKFGETPLKFREKETVSDK